MNDDNASVEQRVKEQVKAGVEEMEQRIHQVEDRVRDRPVSTVLIGLAAGFILGRILR